MAAQVPAIFNPNNRFFYDDLLKKCVGTHTKESVNSAISASVAFITTKSGMWIRKKKAYNGSIYFEFAADLKGISTKHKVIIRSDTGEDSDATTSTKLKDLLLQASIAKICYTDVNFMPYPPNAPKYNPEFFNLFLGFRAQPAERIKPNLVNPIIRHVHEVWCAEDKQLTTYILNWLAFLIQNPDKKPGTAIIMRSPPRCGKNILTDFIGERILGRENFLSTMRLEDVMGRFNAAVRAKKLIILNECDMSGKEWHGANNRLKSLITEPYISIEEKGIDVKVIDDFAGYMILSNHAMPIRIEMGDERFVALNVSAKYKGNREYFSSLVKVLENLDTASSFMSYLLSRDLTGFNPRSIPDTQMKWELIEASIPNPQRFIQYYLEIMWPDNCDTLEIPCTNFYSTYQNWCSEKGENKTLSDNKFGMEIKQFAPKMRVSRSGTRINYYILDKAKIAENFSKVIQDVQDVQDVQEAPVEEVELVAEKPAEEKSAEKKPEPTEEKPEPVEKKPAPVIRKIPPPLPPKPDHLKERLQESREEQPDPDEDTNESDTDEPIDSFSDCYLSDEEPDQEEPTPKPDDDNDVLDDLLSDSDSTTVNPAPEQQPESPAESSTKSESLADSKFSTEPVVEPAPEEQLIPEPDTEPEDQAFDDLYNTGKELWAKYQDASDDYDWEILAFEVEECPTTRIEDEYQYYLMEVVDRFKDWIEYNGYLPKIPSRKELADLIRIYKENRNAEIIPTPSGYETMRADKGKAREIPEERPKTDMEREWEAANGIIDDWNEEDTEGAINDILGAITRLGQTLQARFPDRKFQILLPYENWKPGGWTSGNQPASLFSLLDHYDEAQLPDDADPDYFEQFIIYARDSLPATGGCNGELNDCLYECLKHIYGTFSKMPKSIEKPEYIKKALGLNRDAPIPSKSDRRATLILSEGHYSLALNPGRLHSSKLDKKRNLPIVYHEDGTNNVVTIYNGKTVKSCTIGQFQKTKNSKSSFIPVEKNRKTGVYETLEEAYQRIHEERDVFLQTTKKFGLGIDLSYHNWSYKRTALWLFERLSVGIPANDPLDPIEAEWLSDAMMGGLIWADNEWKGYGRQYDATSLYPSIQQSNANFPIRRGKFQTLNDFVDHRGYALYGLFRAKVSGNNILFRQNKRGIYTFIDLQRAKKLGLNIQLIQDGKPNALIYDREARIPGTVIFGEYVHFLFKIKNQGGVAGRVAKRVLNTLWGALCQRKRNYKTLTANQTDPFTFPEGHTLDSIIPVGSDQWRFQFTNPGNPFKGEYPRIAPFLLARGRKITSEAIQPYKDKVRRIHTDGFILEEQPDSPALFTCSENADTTLKTFKFETAGYCHVKNANKVIWT
ncbi:D5-like helicase-primase [Rhizophagus irregularis DAOM 181602=DAOM 197198]|nr:D5-like helicase-primase [Rhizophagus irregularis DAOM 181602=DAOM 197198]